MVYKSFCNNAVVLDNAHKNDEIMHSKTIPDIYRLRVMCTSGTDGTGGNSPEIRRNHKNHIMK